MKQHHYTQIDQLLYFQGIIEFWDTEKGNEISLYKRDFYIKVILDIGNLTESILRIEIQIVRPESP